jgi:hypothetical protein
VKLVSPSVKETEEEMRGGEDLLVDILSALIFQICKCL